MISLKAYAKINLSLDVLAKRPDGYHEVKMIMQTIDLADDITLLDRPEGISLETDNSQLGSVESNLAYRAAKLLADAKGLSRGVHIVLKKKIPLAAGLAGGSADAAAVLIGVNRLWGTGLSIGELAELGARLGSDIPFCVKGGTMLATGRGEVLELLPSMPACHVVLAKPRIGVSTAWVYQNFRQEMVVERPDTDEMISALGRGDIQGIAGRLCNVLESVTIPAHPEIGQLKTRMRENGALASLMSGSGPTVFGLARDEEQAKQIAAKIERGSDAEIFIAKTMAKMGEGYE